MTWLHADYWLTLLEMPVDDAMDNTTTTTTARNVAQCFAIGWLLTTTSVIAATPSFDCSKIEAGSIPAMVCQDEKLAALDRKLAEVFKAASTKAVNEHPPVLKAMQRGWIKGRDDCWKSEDKYRCVETSYRDRIVELQAMYRLVPITATVTYVCNNNPANQVMATYFQTEPASLVAEYGDSVSLMTIQPAASGAKYLGRNESLWEHQGEATIVWGYEATPMRCKKST